MNILQVHNKYKKSGGEWTVLSQEYELLSRYHNVDQLIVDNNSELNSKFDQLKLIFSTHYNTSSKKRIKKRLDKRSVDVMHVHNFFPLLSPSIFEASREAGIPSVLTLHNFRLIHPNGLMYYKGKIDTRSVNGSAYKCVSDGVYRDSVLQTAVAAHMIEYHRKHKTWEKVPSVFIALSEFSKQTFVEGGLPENRIIIKPNFIEDPAESDPGLLNVEKNGQFIYVGRMSHEKGVEDLIHAWKKHNIFADLVMAGDGPLKDKLEKKTEGYPQISWVGELSRDEIIKKLAESKALIFPTRCYEGQPMILIEAMSVGCPVITSKIGNPQDLVDHQVNGLHFEPGNPDELRDQVDFLKKNGEKRIEMGRKAREKYLANYTPEMNLKKLMDIYERAAEMENMLVKSKTAVKR